MVFDFNSFVLPAGGAYPPPVPLSTASVGDQALPFGTMTLSQATALEAAQPAVPSLPPRSSGNSGWNLPVDSGPPPGPAPTRKGGCYTRVEFSQKPSGHESFSVAPPPSASAGRTSYSMVDFRKTEELRQQQTSARYDHAPPLPDPGEPRMTDGQRESVGYVEMLRRPAVSSKK